MSITNATVPMAFPERSARFRSALIHTLYWVLITAFFIYDKKYMIVKAGLPSFAACVTIRIALLIGIAYINLHFLLPGYLLAGKYWQYFLLVLLSIAGYLLVQALFDIILYGYVLGPMRRINIWETISYNFFSTLWYIGIVIAFKLSIDWYEQKRLLQKTAFEKLQAEVNYLRSQVNPHFLFNALNNLYSLTLKKSDAAPDVVLKLSGMMEYMLYDSDDAAVPLEREIQYLENYVELEKLRYGEHADIQFNMEGDMAGLTIAPLLLLPMVENAFKHGASKTANATWLRCNVKALGNELYIMVENSKSKETQSVNKGGIGLLNLTRRLELLYPDKYDLDIRNREDRFFISLRLQLS